MLTLWNNRHDAKKDVLFLETLDQGNPFQNNIIAAYHLKLFTNVTLTHALTLFPKAVSAICWGNDVDFHAISSQSNHSKILIGQFTQ